MKRILQTTLLGAILLLVPAAARADVSDDLSGPAGIGDLEGVKYLLSKGADVNKQSPSYGTALWNAARGGHFGVVKYLVETAKADVNARIQIPRGSLSLLQADSVPSYIKDYLREHGAK